MPEIGSTTTMTYRKKRIFGQKLRYVETYQLRISHRQTTVIIYPITQSTSQSHCNRITGRARKPEGRN